jgi:hypothetical protein
MSDFLLGCIVGLVLASVFWMVTIKRFFSKPENAMWLSHLLRRKGY